MADTPQRPRPRPKRPARRMAFLIPDTCPAKATHGEQRLYQLLRDRLPERFTAWYEPSAGGRYPDFTLLASDFGLLVLEVKGWYAGQIVRASDQEVELLINRDGESHIRKHRHPYRQAREYMFALKDRLEGEPLLRHSCGPYQGKLCFPVGCAAVLTNIVWEQLDRAGLARLFPPDTALCRDELENLASAESSVVVRRLRQFFPVDFLFTTLTDDRLKTAHGVIHPEVVIRTRPVTPASLPPDHPPTPEARVLEVLDRRQELVVRRLSHGHHVIAGVAGSGKTVLLLARARLLAARDPARRILVLCYNRTLATWLRSHLAEPPASQTAEAASFREWAERLTGLAWDRGSESFEGYEERLGRAALAAAAALPDPEKYDAVLIDEGQDFQPDWLRAACHALKGGAAGDLMIAVDGAQSVYGRPKSFTWKSVGVEAVGRSQTLSKNYRNTKQIIELAWDVTQATAPRGAEHEPHLRVRPTHAVRRGPVPSYLACAGWAEECDRVAAVVRDWMFRTLRPEQIGVLYRRREGRRIEHLYDALRGCGPVCWVTSAADPSTRDRFTDRPGVRLITIHSAKGLQFSGVILAAVDQFPNPFQNDEEADRNLLYVGMTRAEECLILTWCGSTPFTERIRHSPKVAPYT